MRLHLVYATDSGYLLQTLVSACSAVYWASRRKGLNIAVLDCGITDGEWSWFQDKMRTLGGNDFTLKRISVDMSAYGGMKAWHGSKGIYARLDIPRYLPGADWCVYADGDTLFVDDLFKLESLCDKDIAILGHLDRPEKSQQAWHEERNLPWNAEDHFCAGFILMNLKWFRENEGTRKCLDLLERYPDIPRNEQDALNIVCRGRIKLFPDEWGRFAFYQREGDTTGCLHYVWKRPWNMHLGDLFPLLPVHEVWLRSMANVLGVRKWQFAGVGFWRYAACTVKTKVALAGFRVLNVLPGLRGRYDAAVRLAWTNENIDRLVCRPLQACNEEGEG